MSRWENREKKLKVRKNRMRQVGKSVQTLQRIIVARSEALQKGEEVKTQGKSHKRQALGSFIC